MVQGSKGLFTKGGAVAEMVEFRDRAAFRAWLEAHGAESDGVWVRFGKKGGPKTLTAAEALEEALCFGWIDGQMQRIDEGSYKKYFARRTPKSPWSEKNKALAEQLEARGAMTAAGRDTIAEAKKDGRWDAPKAPGVTDEQLSAIAALLEGHEPACANYRAMAPSVRKTYAKAYFSAKTDAGRASRLAWMIERLDRNLKPM